jgi:formate hydrogenlyase subunit 6/NADH:ubiquinone oxidoreductase subunit I
MSFLVMAKTVIKSLLRRPYTVRYPFGPRVYHGNISRGSIKIDIQQCIFCGTCQRKCPVAALTVSQEEKKWSIERLRCIACGYCVESCPKKCLLMENQYSPPLPEHREEVFQNA